MRTKALKTGELDMSLLASNSAPGILRATVKFRLQQWEVDPKGEDIFVVVSELVTNAVRFTQGPEIRVRLLREDGAIVFGVWDSSDDMPVVRALADDLTPDAQALDAGCDAGMCGRGLALVHALSIECRVAKTRPCGKWVWAKVAV